MYRKIAVLLATLVLALSVRSDQSLKCYMCTTMTDEGCDNPETHKLEPVKCTIGKMSEFQRIIQQHNLLNAVVNVFEVDNLGSHQSAVPKDTACAKMMFKISGQDVTVRSCQTAKTDAIDTCKSIVSKVPDGVYEKDNCDLCMHDACNHSGALTPRVFFLVVSVLGAMGLGTLFRAA